MRVQTVCEVGPRLGIAPTCAAVGLATATYYRRISPKRHADRRQLLLPVGDNENCRSAPGGWPAMATV